jgi:hypothetical protein
MGTFFGTSAPVVAETLPLRFVWQRAQANTRCFFPSSPWSPLGFAARHLALRSSALSRRSNHDKTSVDIAYLFPAMKLKICSSKGCW